MKKEKKKKLFCVLIGWSSLAGLSEFREER